MAELTALLRAVVIPGGPDAATRIDPRACRFRLEHGPSPIHRWAIFAAEATPARRVVIEYTGQPIGVTEAWRRSLRTHLYRFWITQKRALDGAIGGSGAEYINHGCAPNLVARVRKGRVVLVSLRLVAVGEELPFDYPVTGKVPLLPCRCASPACRGHMNRPLG